MDIKLLNVETEKVETKDKKRDENQKYFFKTMDKTENKSVSTEEIQQISVAIK